MSRGGGEEIETRRSRTLSDLKETLEDLEDVVEWCSSDRSPDKCSRSVSEPDLREGESERLFDPLLEDSFKDADDTDGAGERVLRDNRFGDGVESREREVNDVTRSSIYPTERVRQVDSKGKM